MRPPESRPSKSHFRPFAVRPVAYRTSATRLRNQTCLRTRARTAHSLQRDFGLTRIGPLSVSRMPSAQVTFGDNIRVSEFPIDPSRRGRAHAFRVPRVGADTVGDADPTRQRGSRDSHGGARTSPEPKRTSRIAPEVPRGGRPRHTRAHPVA